MKEILVIPDVHGRRFWKDAVEKYPELPTIFLGDYHDPYPDEGISVKNSLSNFQEIINYSKSRENVLLLLGNHDLHYLCNFGEACRLDYENSSEIHYLLLDNLKQMKIAHLAHIGDKNVIFSHAPILKPWVEAVGLEDDAAEIVSRLNSLLETIVMEPWETEKMIGHTSFWRGGNDSAGSPVWADCREINHNLLLSVDFSIFGHTQLKNSLISENWANLDCRHAFVLSSDLSLRQI